MSQLLERPIDVWLDEDLLLRGVRPHPLLMHLTPPDTNPELKFWNLLRNQLKDFVKVHTFKRLEEAGHLIVIPNPLQDYIHTRKLGEVLKFKDRVLASGRTPVLTTGLEYSPQSKEIVFSMSTYRLSLSDGMIPTPAWLYDLGSKILPLPKPTKPTVGFVGASRYPGRLNTLVSYLPIPGSVIEKTMCSAHINGVLSLGMRQPFAQRLRGKVLNEARKSLYLDTSFIIRKSGFFDTRSIDAKEKARSEYLQNIQDNAYTLCIRGTENYSYRLYEVMSAGRIPIIIDTNMQLPNLNAFGRWDEFSVIVPSSKVNHLGEIVQEFHNRLSNEEFESACYKSRAAFEYLLPHQFVLRTLQQKLQKLMIDD